MEMCPHVQRAEAAQRTRKNHIASPRRLVTEECDEGVTLVLLLLLPQCELDISVRLRVWCHWLKLQVIVHGVR